MLYKYTRLIILGTRYNIKTFRCHPTSTLTGTNKSSLAVKNVEKQFNFFTQKRKNKQKNQIPVPNGSGYIVNIYLVSAWILNPYLNKPQKPW